LSSMSSGMFCLLIVAMCCRYSMHRAILPSLASHRGDSVNKLLEQAKAFQLAPARSIVLCEWIWYYELHIVYGALWKCRTLSPRKYSFYKSFIFLSVDILFCEYLSWGTAKRKTRACFEAKDFTSTNSNSVSTYDLTYLISSLFNDSVNRSY
jgi:hypothetical protein